MFTPPRCPNVECAMHAAPTADFFERKGYYHPKCRAHPVPRFRCRGCRRGFSRQTFRVDYYDHRPDRNAFVFFLLASGLGLRQTARLTRLTRRVTTHKFRKIARHLKRLNGNLIDEFDAACVLQLDELETYETRRSTRPLTLPVLIERHSRYLVAALSAPIRPSGTMTEARRRAVAEDEARDKRRPSRSRAAVRKALKRARAACAGLRTVVLQSDEKSTYPALARQVFGAERLRHQRTSSRLPRTTWNPLFPINHTEAMARDLTGRLRRESWLVSKRRWFLNLQLHLYAAYRNFLRPRFNYDRETPAQLLGWTDRPIDEGRLLGWRQDWGRRSIHPLARDNESVSEWVARHRAARRASLELLGLAGAGA